MKTVVQKQRRCGKSRLDEEKEDLQRSGHEVARKKVELEKASRRLKNQAAKARQKTKIQTLNVSMTRPRSPYGALGRRPPRSVDTGPRLRGSRRADRVQFFLLSLILFIIGMLIWRTLPA